MDRVTRFAPLFTKTNIYKEHSMNAKTHECAAVFYQIKTHFYDI